MITLNVGPTVITVCESTAKCAIYKPTETCFDLLIETIDKNNYICEIVYSENLQLAQKVAYYAGGTPTDDQTLAQTIESKFE
jgi:hypothetical protein